MSFFNNSPDNKTLLLWAAVAFAAYWLFFKNAQVETYDAPRASTQQQPPQPYQNEELQTVTAPPPEEIPQYANAYVM